METEPDPPADSEWIRQAHVDLEGLWEVAAFRLYEAYDVVVRPRWRLELDTQPYGEIWLIRKGLCSITLGEQEAVAGPGQVVVLRPGQPRVSANGGSEPLALVGFGCSVLLFETVDLLARLELPLVVSRPSQTLRRLIRDTVRAVHGGGTGRVFRARALAELALEEIVAGTRTDLPSQPLALREEIRAALAYVAEHYSERLDLTSIASAVHLSPKYLTRRFRESLGITPMAYVRRYRLNRAREQLVTTELPITRIAFSTGFQEPAHFSRAFRAQFGVSPRIVRDHARALQSTTGYSEASMSSVRDVPSMRA